MLEIIQFILAAIGIFVALVLGVIVGSYFLLVCLITRRRGNYVKRGDREY